MPRRNSDHPDYGADVVPLFEAACRLGMHPKTYVKGIDLGQLPGTRLDKTVVIPRKSYERFLDEGRMPESERSAA